MSAAALPLRRGAAARARACARPLAHVLAHAHAVAAASTRAHARAHARSMCVTAGSAPAPACVSLAVSADGIALITLDAPNAKVNTLSRAMIEQMEPVISALETDTRIRAAVVISGKPDNFIAGADISMLDAVKTPEALTDLSRQGQVLMDRLEAASKQRPIVAAINGSCLGGGLEVALACSYRIATSGAKTRLGVPEVQLGLLPGSGGTQRLPRIVGISSALTLMTTGQQLRADRALKMGLVHEVVDPSALKHAAIAAARELVRGELKPKARKRSLFERLLEDNPLGRALLFSRAEATIREAAGGHYPAPLAILEAVKVGVNRGHAAGSVAESTGFGKLGATTVSAALRGIFFAQTATKKNPGGKVAAPAQRVGILGAGLMGSGIAQVTAAAGIGVVVKDRDRASLARGEKQIVDALTPRVKKRQMTAWERDALTARIVSVSDEDSSWQRLLARADIVIEAVPEDLALKHRVLASVEPLLSPKAVFASNTSALPIADIATAAKRPERVIGMHYFSPVDKMPLLEIIPHAGTAPDALAAAFDLGLRQGKTVIVVKDVPGFYVNRCLSPWAAEGLFLAQQGVEPAALDAAIRGFGYPVGPVTLADEVGIDVLLHTYETMKAALGERMAGADDTWLRALVESRALGRKTGKGFYLYPADAKKSGSKAAKQINPDALALMQKYRAATSPPGVSPSMPADAIAERMVMRFVKECIHSLEDGVIRSPADGDIGAVFGLGFPPFHGGPFRYADTLGLQKVADTMSRLADANGKHFAPPASLIERARAGKTFHGSK